MALVEVEEGTLRLLGAQHAELQRMLNDPKTRPEFLKLYKQVFPNVAIPEIDARGAVESKIDDLKKLIDEDKAARAKERDEVEVNRRKGEFSKWQSEGRLLLAKRGVPEKSIEAVEKLMTDRGLNDYEAAFALFRDTQPADEPVVSRAYSPTVGMRSLAGQETDDDMKLLFKGGKARAGVEFAQRKVNEFFAERDAARGRRL